MPADMTQSQQQLERTLTALQDKERILFLTTSNRWKGEGEEPKSTRLAHEIAGRLPEGRVTIIDIPTLNIAACEGNVSTASGNNCGVKKALLDDPEKNPTGQIRCWASLNNPDDELWKVATPLLQADAVVFFASVRWGQTNSYYQKLIERLTWLENRHTALGEDNLIENTAAGIIIVGQNWHGAEALATQKQVLDYYGFAVNEDLCWNWQYTENAEDESDTSYQDADDLFTETFISK